MYFTYKMVRNCGKLRCNEKPGQELREKCVKHPKKPMILMASKCLVLFPRVEMGVLTTCFLLETSSYPANYI